MDIKIGERALLQNLSNGKIVDVNKEHYLLYYVLLLKKVFKNLHPKEEIKTMNKLLKKSKDISYELQNKN